MDTKRDPVYNENKVWIGTKPKVVKGYAGQQSTIQQLELKMLQDEYYYLTKQSEIKDQTIAELQSEIAKPVMSNSNQTIAKETKAADNLTLESNMNSLTKEIPIDTTLLEEKKPTLYPPKKSKAFKHKTKKMKMVDQRERKKQEKPKTKKSKPKKPPP